MKALARALVLHGKVRTTEAKAKELRKFVEPFVTRAKSGTLANLRLLRERFGSDVVIRLMRDIGPRYKERKGGYTRITKQMPRKTDTARMAIVEFV